MVVDGSPQIGRLVRPARDPQLEVCNARSRQTLPCATGGDRRVPFICLLRHEAARS